MHDMPPTPPHNTPDASLQDACLIPYQLPDVFKVCTVCGDQKPLDAFSPHAGRQYGRDGTCKACRASRRREHVRVARWKRAGKSVQNLVEAQRLKGIRKRFLGIGQCLGRKAGGVDGYAKMFMELIQAARASGGHAACRANELMIGLQIEGTGALEKSLRAERAEATREQRREQKREMRKARRKSDRRRRSAALRRLLNDEPADAPGHRRSTDPG